MLTLADRIAKAVADLTIGTVIVLAHIALADRHHRRAMQPMRDTSRDGSRVWRTQISP